MAQLPAALPLLVGAPVDDLGTLRIYEVVFALLDEIGIPVEERVDHVAMYDAVVLGSAVDGSAPAPLWQVGEHDMPFIEKARVHGDDAGRTERGLELAIDSILMTTAVKVVR